MAKLDTGERKIIIDALRQLEGLKTILKELLKR
jgi:hypothetical protein